MKYPRALTIAGSDSGGGAGIQADLKTFAALGVYGMSVITSVTAQNTREVRGVRDLPPDIVAGQIEAVLEDIGADAVKTGMLSNASLVETVTETLAHFGVTRLVVDPVMVSKSGAALLRDDSREALKSLLLPMALLVTPNIPEAEALCGLEISGEAEIRRAGEALLRAGARNVLIKGGHLSGDTVVDWLFSASGETARFESKRTATKNTHGTGCTFSAAICAYLALGLALPEAVGAAKKYLDGCITHADELEIGHGHGPLDHNWMRK